jgi:hypothetical protein
MWVNYDSRSGAPSARASYNLSSFTDNGVGNITLNFSSAIGDANYSIAGSSSYETTGTGNSRSSSVCFFRDFASGSVRMLMHSITTADGAYGDSYLACAILCR